jgi:hypothetical protein
MADTQFTVQIVGLDQLVARLQEAPSIAAPILQRAIDASHAILAKYTTNRGIVPWRTGFLAQQWGWESTTLSGRWFPRASYAPYVEFGTKPHVILPKDKKALSWPGAAHPVARVNHPGTKPNDFMGRIVAAAQPDINAMFTTALQQIVAQIAAQ